MTSRCRQGTVDSENVPPATRKFSFRCQCGVTILVLYNFGFTVDSHAFYFCAEYGYGSARCRNTYSLSRPGLEYLAVTDGVLLSVVALRLQCTQRDRRQRGVGGASGVVGHDRRSHSQHVHAREQLARLGRKMQGDGLDRAAGDRERAAGEGQDRLLR